MSREIELLGKLVPQAIADTFIMTSSASLITLLLGLPIGLILFATQRGGLFENPWINRPIGALVDAIRAVPFIILAIYLIPVTRLAVGKIYGNWAMIFVLSVSAIPFYARMAQMSFRSVDKNLIDAIRALGATRFQVIREVLLPEALSSLITGFTVTVIAIIGATAMAGFIGGGGLGPLAINYGYQRYILVVMNTVVGILILLNIAVQWFGDRMAHKFDRTKRH